MCREQNNDSDWIHTFILVQSNPSDILSEKRFLPPLNVCYVCIYLVIWVENSALKQRGVWKPTKYIDRSDFFLVNAVKLADINFARMRISQQT